MDRRTGLFVKPPSRKGLGGRVGGDATPSICSALETPAKRARSSFNGDGSKPLKMSNHARHSWRH